MVQNCDRAVMEKSFRLPDAAMREVLRFLDRANISRFNLLNRQAADLLQGRRFAAKPLRRFRSLGLDPSGEAHGYWATLVVGNDEGMAFDCDATLSEIDDCLWPEWVRFKRIYIRFTGWKCVSSLRSYSHILRHADVLTLDFTKTSDLARYEEVVRLLKGSGVHRMELILGDYMPARLHRSLLDGAVFYECHELNINAGYVWSGAHVDVTEEVLVDWLHHDADVQRRLHITAQGMGHDSVERLVQLLVDAFDTADSSRTYLLELQHARRDAYPVRVVNGRTGEELRVRNISGLNSILFTRRKLKATE